MKMVLCYKFQILRPQWHSSRNRQLSKDDSLFECILSMQIKKENVVKTHDKYEPRHEKTCLLGLRPGKTQTGLLSHRD